MGSSPANWKWCQGASKEERKNYYERIKGSDKEMGLENCQCDCAGFCEVYQRKMDEKGFGWCKKTTEEKREWYALMHNPFLARDTRKTQRHGLLKPLDFRDDIQEPSSDYALVVVNANPYSESHLALTKDAIVEYAEKCGADYIELTGDQCPEFSIYNKFRIHAVTKRYKKTLFLDADICVNKNTPNIFDITPDDKISAFVDHELFMQDDSGRTYPWIEEALDSAYLSGCDDYPEENRDNQMINSGVLVIPQSLSDYYKQPVRKYLKFWCFDQIHLTLMLPKDKLNTLGVEWNNTAIPNEDKFLERLDDTYFDHLNGGEGVSQGVRLQLMYILTKFDKSDIDKERIKEIVHTRYTRPDNIYTEKISYLARESSHLTDPMYFLTFYDGREHPFCVNTDYTSQILEASAVTKQRVECENFNSVKILSLGHCDEQFSSIKDRPYIEKVNLNKLKTNLGKEWAESRIYDMDFEELFGDSEIVGLTTASWNLKYVGLNPIDLFHKWDAAKLLVGEKRKDILLGGQSDCVCVLINRYQHADSEFFRGVFYKDLVNFDVEKFDQLLQDLNLTTMCKRTLFSNQIIGHRDTVKQLFDFYKNNDILNKIKKCSEGVKACDNKYFDKAPAYFSEYITALWIANQDLTLLPQECFSRQWYQPENMKKRMSWKR